MISNRICFVLSMFLMMTSCLKRIDGPLDPEISPYIKIEINLDQPNEYRNKVYYDLESKSIVKTSNSLDWHIAFSTTSSDKLKVIMNYAMGITCNGFTKNDTLWSRTMTEDDFLNNRLYYANHYDSLANLFASNFSNGVSNQWIYYLQFGKYLSYKKVQILQATNAAVSLRYANLDGSDERTVTIPVRPNTNYTYFSLKDHVEKDIEPAGKMTWDLEFTHYTTLVTEFNDTRMYGVTGVLTNPAKALGVSIIDQFKLEDIKSSNLANGTYGYAIGQIGYNWKKFSSSTPDGFYTIPTKSYIIYNQSKYFGIQFIEFSKIINNVQVKGYPTFLQRDF